MMAGEKCLWHNCPMAGKWAPYLASGIITSTFTSLIQASESQLHVWCEGLSDDDRTTVLRDWAIARNHLEYLLTTKTRYWAMIPWRLCGLLHHDQSAVMHCASACLSQFDAAIDPSVHHRVSVKFLAHDSPFRACVESLAQGAPLWSMPDDFVMRLIPLKYIPCVERAIEGRHGLITTRLTGKKKARSPITMSLSSGRLDEFARRLDVHGPQVLVDLVDCFEQVRNSKRIIERLNLMDLPCIQPLWQHGNKVHHTRWFGRVAEAVYHCDLGAARGDQHAVRG